MIKTNFYLKTGKENDKGESPIYAKISLQGKSLTLSSGKFISKERWLSTNRLKNSLRLGVEKNCKTALDILKAKIESTYFELIQSNLKPDLHDIKNKLKGNSIQKEELDIIKLFERHNSHFAKKVECGERSKASLQKYNRAKTLITNFIKIKYAKSNFSITEIDNQFVFNFETFLKYESNYNGKIGIGHNSVIKYFQCYKTVCNFGIKTETLKHNPFLVYDEKMKKRDAVCLTEDELYRVEKKQFSTERLNRVKDIFLFSCYTGYAPIDVQKLTTSNIIRDNNGKNWIKTYRTKTNIKSDVPILPPAQRIIDKYAFLEGKTLLPTISNQKMNEYLKEIADLCGINKKLTHYVARHTFATTVTLGNGVSIENVSKMMGHTNITTTQIYAKVLNTNVMKDMSMLSQKIT